MHPEEQAESPRKKASLLSQLFFAWLLPLFQKGYRKTLELKDLYRVLPEDQSRILGDKLEKAWNAELMKSFETRTSSEKSPRSAPYKPSLVKALIKVYGPTYAAYGIYAFYEECILKVSQPLCLGLLLGYFSSPDEYDPWVGFLFAGIVLILSITYTSSDHPFTFAVQHLGMKMRISLSALLYRKALRMSKSALEETTAGQIVNFLSSDMNRFDVCMTFLHYLWVAPLQLVLVIGVMYIYIDIGWPCVAGIALLIIFVPVQGLMGKVFSKLRAETASKTDKRLVLMEETLSAMRVIKLYAWEKIFMDSLQDARKEEVKALRKTCYLKALNQSLFYVTSRVTLFLTLIAYVLDGNHLTSEVVFVSLALYNSVQSVMTLFFPAGVTSLAESMIGIRRFQEFLLLDEFERPLALGFGDEHKLKYETDGNSQVAYSITQSNYLEKPGPKPKVTPKKVKKRPRIPDPDVGVSAKNLTAQWNPISRDMAFNSISLDVKRGEVIGLIGPVGAGKGSILQSILYELPIKNGDLQVKGSIGYVSQEPWIFPGSVRDNILFGKEFEPSWYEDVIEACALTKDLSLLPYADHTLVGDRGTALSGGQKARINLARAVYADADIYLLDDPLSAVDSEVGRHLVNKCILGILKDKARILVTHQLQYLSWMTEVVLINDGWTTFRGSYKNLLQSGIPFTELLTRIPFESKVASRSASHHASPRASQHVGAASNVHIYPSHRATSSSTLVLENIGKVPASPEHPNKYIDQELMRLENANGTGAARGGGDATEPEELQEELGTGALSWKLYWTYLGAGSNCFALVIIIIVAFITQVTFTCSDLWLQIWIEVEETNTSNSILLVGSKFKKQIESDQNLQIGIYSSLVTMLFILCLSRSINFYRLCMRSSSALHQKLLYAVIRSPMSFFENNPMGRILNRFAKDVGVIDETLPPVIFDSMEIFLQSMGVIFIVSSSSPIMLVPATLMLFVFYFVRKFYFHTARSIKRLEGVARSPLFSHMSTTINGLTTIRAFGVEPKFQVEFESLLDVHSSVWYLFLSSSRWLGIVVDWISILFVACVLLNFLLDNRGDAVVGLALTSAMMLTSMLQWGIRQSAELANQMISVERISEYCDLEPEAALESDGDKKPPREWPSRGEIKIRNLSLHYSADSPTLILNNINCTFKSGEKVGVVGRTGAGKSSLLSVLFRIAEPTQGFIEIDGVITSGIGLHELRSRISIIPQEPVLFMGSIRSNLDPFGEFSDLQVWEVLKNVNLDEAVNDLPLGIYATIAEGGTNFSMGQKQLFCLARAILRSNKILVLDEATANVDPETDALIQKTIRTSFATCTVITIAHRLHTVMDSDRILVLDAGMVMEFDEPDKLLEDRRSALHKFVEQSGKTEAANLLHIARLAGARRRKARKDESDDEDDDDDDDD